ncbi:MAG: isoleucine--tRNA ligase [Clostridia bacterium]|nr:isoleucine--tRNA ligase [Clostridia bacterium]
MCRDCKKYRELPANPDFPKIQESVLGFWDKNRIFERSVNERSDKETVFYDGPPFPTGKPHHGTVLVSFIKDMLARYWTMRGYRVPRVWGWDCHGLPIENKAEKKLGITNKNEIERNIGIDKFNDACYGIVSENNESWREYVRYMARWVDYENAYKTMNPSFMESVMWAFKTCYDKGYIYRDYRVTPYCTHCETSLSISDTRESDSTRPRQDRWIVVQFKTPLTREGKDVYLLAWTTTPWTLPSNMCLAVGADLTYSFVDVGDRLLVACRNTLKSFPKVFGKEPNIVYECKGSELVGTTYEPIFPYFADKKNEGAFRVISADYVGAEDGVGIVHTAPAFGEDDYWACKNNNVPLVDPVDAKGRFTKEITDFYELQSDELNNVIKMNPTIIRFLRDKGIALDDGTLVHNYPHCWRCKEPLIYKAMDAYYFNIGMIKDKLIAKNEEVNWIPETVKHGRFGNWLEGARDWNISRNRYWSTPIPIWECPDCGEKVVLGSVEEIYQKSGIRLTNLHRQYMDEVTFPCKCGGRMTRVPEVLDCWFESGSVPFAQKHYPFENKEWFESHFPCDFIVEYTGQIRCWFYYLHVLAVALFDRPAFKNCVVHGTILDDTGKKFSKSSANYTDPMEIMKNKGTDSFRLYLFQSNAMLIGDLKFKDEDIDDSYRELLAPYWNACKFFISYANIDGFKPDTLTAPKSDNLLDKWILAKLFETERTIRESMDRYEVDQYVKALIPLMDGLTNWYIRNSRRRFWASEMSEDKRCAYETLYYVLVNITKLFAPVAPIIAEEIYKTLTDEDSVHLALWPEIPAEYENSALIRDIDVAQSVIELARNIRNTNRVKNRQPLSLLRIASSSPAVIDTVRRFETVILEELNVKNIEIMQSVEDIATVKYNPNFAAIGQKYPDKKGLIIRAIKTGEYRLTDDAVELDLGGETVRCDKDIILVLYEAKDGLAVASAQEIVVSLDLTITDELLREGCAREIIRSIQDARKQLGCEIVDEIKIAFIEGTAPEGFADYITGETLSRICEIDTPDTVIDVDGIKIAVKR